MASYYELTKSIRITNAGPVDGDRYLAANTTVRDNLISQGRAFNGLQVFVQDIGKLYILEDKNVPTWTEIPIGAAGGDKTYVYTDNESTASALWTIDHSLGKYPSVVVVGSDNKEVECEIEYNSISQIQLRFNAPFAGKAFLN